MNPSDPSSRRRREIRLAPELLESRALMTGGAGSTFAIIPGEITKAGQPAAIKFTIDPAHFTLPKGKFTLGIDIAPVPGGTLKPLISSVDDPRGRIVPQTFHSTYDPHVANAAVAAGAGTSAVLTPVKLDRSHPNAPVTYTVNVQGVQGTTGKFLIGFYLPGDAKGNGVVDQADAQIVKTALGSKSNQTKYNFDADVNRDGRIGQTDLTYTRQNQGVATTISPVVSANLDAATTAAPNSRVVTQPFAHFTGIATPNAAVKYVEVGNKTQPVATTADAKGDYNLMIPLANGDNTFQITTLDAFGQSITGTIAPVTYTAPPTAKKK